MAVNDYKITDTQGKKVSDVPGSTLSGTVAQNKAVFDQLGELIISRYNALIDYLRTKGIDTATNTATLSSNGLMSATDKTKLNSLTTATATTSAAGYMSATDKTKLNSLTTATATTSAAGYMSATDKTKLNSLTTATATTSAAGYMSATDKTKLNSLETNFNGQFETDNYTIAVINGGTNTGSYSISKSGYKPVAISGFYTSNTDMFVNRLCLTTVSVGSGTIAWGCTNTNMRQTSEQLTVYVLWIKNTI